MEEPTSILLKSVVERRLAELERNPFEAARKGSLERSFVNDILIGRKTSVRADKLPDLARALDWTLAELMRRISPSAPPSNGSAEIMGSVSEAFAVALEAPPLADLDIPVLGAIGAADFQAPRLTNTEMVPKPWPLRGREGIYALYVVGGSMAPIFPSGATIYVDSKAEPKQGDYAVFKATSYPGAKESRRYLRLVKAISDTHLHCAQISPPIEDYHRIENIKWMHRIIMPGE